MIHINDIGHYFANGVKSYLKNKKWWHKIIEISNGASRKMMMNKISHLRPPSIRTGLGRYMSISGPISYLLKMTYCIDKLVITKKGSIDEKIKLAFPGILTHTSRLVKLKATIDIMNQIQSLLKTQGGSSAIILEAEKLANSITIRILKKRIKGYLEETKNSLKLLQDRGFEGAIPVSTDAIESLFGSFKHFLKRAPRKEINSSWIFIPIINIF